MLVQKIQPKHQSVAIILFILCMFGCCLYTVHDMQTAEGIGLFFSMQLGMSSRTIMDIVVDALCIGVLALLIYLPCQLLGYKSLTAYCRLLIVYLAAVPSLSLAKVLQLFREDEVLFLWDCDLLSGVWQWFYGIAGFLQVWVPLLVLLYAFAGEKCRFLSVKWHKIVLLAECVLIVILLCVPTAENLILYLCGYMGLLLAFDCWETLLRENKTPEKWSYILYALLLLKGIYRIVILVSQV